MNDRAIKLHAAAQAEVNHCWKMACVFEGINPKSKFVVFAKDNPYILAYNEAMTALQKLRKQIKKNEARRLKHAILTEMGLKRVVGAQGGVYYE